MTKIEFLIVKEIAERYGVPEEMAARWLGEVVKNGTDSVFFNVVAPPALEVIQSLWASLAPLLSDVTPEPSPRRKCASADLNATIENRPGDRVMVCPMGGNIMDRVITCEWCGQSSMTPERS